MKVLITGATGAVTPTVIAEMQDRHQLRLFVRRQSNAKGDVLVRDVLSLDDCRGTVLPEAHIWAEICHLADCIAHDRLPPASAEHARHVIEPIEEGYTAARMGCVRQLQTNFTLPVD